MFFRVRVQGLGPGCRRSSIKKLLKKCKMAVVKVWQKHFFMYKFVSLLKRVIIVHKDIKNTNTFRELRNNKRHSHFCTRSYKGNWHLFIMTSYRSKPFAAAKKRKIRVFNTNHKYFIVIQNFYDFFLHKVHIDMNVYINIFL